jgi:DNA-binding transcriptional MerR regulator
MSEGYLTVEKFVEYLKEKENIVVSKRTLRFYVAEKIFPPPEKRGGNVAYYSLDKVPKLKVIDLLKASGLSIAQIRRKLNSSTYITPEALVKVEDAVIDGINEMLKARIAYLQNTYYGKRGYGTHPLRDSLKRLQDRIRQSYGEDDYLSFISRVTGSLEAYICAFPLKCTDEQLDDLLGITKAAKLRLRIRKVKHNMGLGSVENIKGDVKKRLKDLIGKHMSRLQDVLNELDAM